MRAELAPQPQGIETALEDSVAKGAPIGNFTKEAGSSHQNRQEVAQSPRVATTEEVDRDDGGYRFGASITANRRSVTLPAEDELLQVWQNRAIERAEMVAPGRHGGACEVLLEL